MPASQARVPGLQPELDWAISADGVRGSPCVRSSWPGSRRPATGSARRKRCATLVPSRDGGEATGWRPVPIQRLVAAAGLAEGSPPGTSPAAGRGAAAPSPLQRLREAAVFVVAGWGAGGGGQLGYERCHQPVTQPRIGLVIGLTSFLVVGCAGFVGPCPGSAAGPGNPNGGSRCWPRGCRRARSLAPRRPLPLASPPTGPARPGRCWPSTTIWPVRTASGRVRRSSIRSPERSVGAMLSPRTTTTAYRRRSQRSKPRATERGGGEQAGGGGGGHVRASAAPLSWYPSAWVRNIRA